MGRHSEEVTRYNRMRMEMGLCSIGGCPNQRSEKNRWYCDKHRLQRAASKRAYREEERREMKKLTLVLLVIGLLVGSDVSAVNTQWRGRTVDIATSSVQTESKSITTGAGLFYGIVVRTDGTNDVTLNIYDGKSASGTKLTPANVVIDGASYAQGWSFSTTPAITYTGGIYVDVSVAGGGSCSYQVFYFTLP